MCADRTRITGSISNGHLENGQNDPICVAVNIDINDISDGALKVLKQIKPFWPINNVQFKVRYQTHAFDPLCFFLFFFFVSFRSSK